MSHLSTAIDSLENQQKLKLDKFSALYLDPKSETYGNATRSAIKAFGYKDPEEYNAARFAGTYYLAKLQNVINAVLEDQNATIPYLVKFALKEMLDNKGELRLKWWKEIAWMSGLKKMADINLIVQQQNNLTINVNDSEKANFNEAFKKFLQSQPLDK